VPKPERDAAHQFDVAKQTAAKAEDPNVFLPPDRGTFADVYTYHEPPRAPDESDEDYAARAEREWLTTRQAFVQNNAPIIRAAEADAFRGGPQEMLERIQAQVRRVTDPMAAGVDEAVTAGAGRELGVFDSMRSDEVEAALKAAGQGDSAQRVRRTMAANPAATVGGNVAGVLLPGPTVANAAMRAGGAVARGARKLIPQLAGRSVAGALSRGLPSVAGGAATGAAMGTASQAVRGELDAAETAKSAGLGAVLPTAVMAAPVLASTARAGADMARFGSLDRHLLGGGVSKLLGRAKKPPAFKATDGAQKAAERLKQGYQDSKTHVGVPPTRAGARPAKEAANLYGQSEVGQALDQSPPLAAMSSGGDVTTTRPTHVLSVPPSGHQQVQLGKYVDDVLATGSAPSTQNLQRMLQNSPGLNKELDALIAGTKPGESIAGRLGQLARKVSAGAGAGVSQASAHKALESLVQAHRLHKDEETTP
jgi:hypothetical protein